MNKINKINETSIPKISVVICAYNVSKLINNIFDSLDQQTFKDFEVVVVNDGSIDDTSEIASSRGARVIDIPHSGLSAARNYGINNSLADIVAIIDADCYAVPVWLETIYQEMQNEVVMTGNTKIPKSTFLGDCISGLGYPGGGHLGFDKMWPVDKDGYTIHLSGGNCAFHKKKIQELGAFNPELTITADDVYLAMKVRENGLKIKYNPNMVMYHPPRKKLKEFVHWHYSRGKGQHFFKKQVKSFGQFYKLRIWSTKNMIKQYKTDPKLLVMLPLLALSFATQKCGYLVQKYNQ